MRMNVSCVCCCWGEAQRRSRRERDRKGHAEESRREGRLEEGQLCEGVHRDVSVTVTGCLSDDVRAGWDGRRTVIKSEPTLPQLQRYTGRNSTHIDKDTVACFTMEQTGQLKK